MSPASNMPIYEYVCAKCRGTFEYMKSMSEPPKKKCEKCGGKLERQISAAGFILKGGGWYKDLYASPKPGGGAEATGGADTGGSSDSGEKAGGKTEKKEGKASAA